MKKKLKQNLVSIAKFAKLVIAAGGKTSRQRINEKTIPQEIKPVIVGKTKYIDLNVYKPEDFVGKK